MGVPIPLVHVTAAKDYVGGFTCIKVCWVMFRLANIPRALGVDVDEATLLRAGPLRPVSFTVRTSLLNAGKLLCYLWSGQWWTPLDSTVYVSPRDHDVLS